jgi:cellulose biosynthesis protein BcsQ
MAKEGQIVTFYSYKGGTGRTMSVANTACLLARRLAADAASTGNVRVIAVDWDFEAPGLHRYFLPYLSADIRASLDQVPGCIDLLDEIWRSRDDFGTHSFRNRETAKSLLDKINFKRYLIATTIPGLAIIKSGRHDSAYAQLVNAFNWEDFFYKTEGFFPGFADFLRESFDYVLIDSRTGVTDTSGICTTLLPDKLVVPFTANLQSLSGVEDVVRRAVNYRKQSEDWRPLSVFPLPSRIDISRPTLAEQWRKGVHADGADADSINADVAEVGYQAVFERLFAQLFGPDTGKLASYFDEVMLQHVPDYAYGEPIAVELETTDSRIFLRRSYEAFVDRLTELAGPWESLEAARRDRDVAALISEARERLGRAREGTDPRGSEDLIRLGLRIVETDAGPATAEEMIEVVLAIAQFAIRANPSGATLLTTAVLERVARFGDDEWHIYAKALQQAGELFDGAGIYEQAEQYHRQHLELLQRHLEADNLAVVAAMQQLSLTLLARDNSRDARTLQHRVVDTKLRVLGESDPDTLASMNVLAKILQSHGDVDGARSLRQRVEDIGRQARGERPGDMADHMVRSDVRTVRVFVSSPADVIPERERVSRILSRLDAEFAGSAQFMTIRWEQEFYSAGRTFQAQIASPAEADLAVFIFWSRAGTVLPSEFHRADGTSYISGTEYELETALQGSRAHGTPDVFVYRKTAKIVFEADGTEQRQAGLQALEALWTRVFRTEDGQFRSAFSTFESTDEFEELLERHIRKWAQDRVGPRAGKLWAMSPFRGLAPFLEEHAPVFFGRRRQVDQLRDRLIEFHGRGCPFLLLLGASGSGKTSLLRAGLLPRLLAPGSVPEVELWQRALVFRPHELLPNTALRLAQLLLEHVPSLSEGDARSPERLAQLLASNPEEAAGLLKAALARSDARRSQASDRARALRLLLILDQLEEIFAVPAGERVCVIELIDALVRGSVAWVVAALRSDFYGALLEAGPTLLRLKDDGGQYDLQPPRPADLREIIQGPARVAGISFEKNAAGESVDEAIERDAADEPGALPLVEFVLDELYRRGPGDAITFEAYHAIGGLHGAIGHVAENVYASVSPEAQSELPALLVALVDDDDSGNARLGLRAAELATATTTAAARDLLDALISRRLLVASERTGGHEPGVVVRAAHEAVFLHWPRARDIIAHLRPLLTERQRLQADAADWVRSGRNSRYLVSGFRLARAVRLRSALAQFIAPELREFVERSFVRARRHRLVLTAAGAWVVLALVLSGWYVLDRNREVERLRRETQASLSLALDVTANVVGLAQVLSSNQPGAAAPLVAKALAAARELAKADPDNRQAQEYLSQLIQLCQAVKCAAP